MREFRPVIEWRRIDLIYPSESNAKLHPKEQVNKLAQSISQLGFEVPISIADNGEIIAGEGRYLAAKSLSMEMVPVIVRKDLTPEEVRIRRLVDNSLAVSGYDNLIMERELEDLRNIGVDLKLFGASEDELLKLSNDIDSSLKKLKNKDHGEGKQISDPEVQLILTIRFNEEEQMKEIYQELLDRGLDVKIFS